MLWDVVYEFFIKYIFGGVLVEGNNIVGYDASLGGLLVNNDYHYYNTTNIGAFTFGPFTFSLGNYLSLIATIISMVVIVVLACLFIKKIYNMCAHIIA